MCGGNAKQEKRLNLNYHSFYSCYDDLVFDSCPVQVNRWYHSCFVRFQQIFVHFLWLFLHGTGLLLLQILQATPLKPQPLWLVWNIQTPNDSLQWVILLFSYIKCLLWNNERPRRVLLASVKKENKIAMLCLPWSVIVKNFWALGWVGKQNCVPPHWLNSVA